MRDPNLDDRIIFTHIICKVKVWHGRTSEVRAGNFEYNTHYMGQVKIRTTMEVGYLLMRIHSLQRGKQTRTDVKQTPSSDSPSSLS